MVTGTNAVVSLLAERIQIILILISSIALTTTSHFLLHSQEVMESMCGMWLAVSILISYAVIHQTIKVTAILKSSRL
jgi:hypothetical protein